MNNSFNKDRRGFLSSTAKMGLCIACGGMVSALLSSCDTIDEGEPKINIVDSPELQKVGGIVRKRYLRLNNGEAIFVIRHSETQFMAYAAQCTHKGVELNLPKDGVMKCPNHGSRFRINDGTVIDGKAYKPLQRFTTVFDPHSNTLTIS